MFKKTIEEIQEEYDLELDRIIKTVKKEKAKKVLLQFPDGLKPISITIVDYLKSKVKNTEFFIWLGSCFGACDIPNISEKDVDLIIQFGHTSWGYNKNSDVKVVK